MNQPEQEFWLQRTAVTVCRAIEQVCPPFGCHVALTGGLLYKDGERKDLDILFYRIRQVPQINKEGLFAALVGIGFEDIQGFGWLHKAVYMGKSVDIFFPEEDEVAGEPSYPEEPILDENGLGPPDNIQELQRRIDAAFI